MKAAISVALLASVAIGAAHAAAPANKAKEAAIHFADSGGIYDYKAVNDHELYIQSRDRSWYKAELLGPCDGLQYATGIGFQTEPSGDLTKFGAVLVNGHRCVVTSLVAIEGKPPKNAK